MEPILVVGADTVVGANLCVHWAERFEICGLSESRVPLDECQLITGAAARRDPKAILAEHQPKTVILCGPASQSSWDPATLSAISATCVSQAETWAAAAQTAGIHFVFISADAVFSGPWMFHDEDSESVCGSGPAATIRQAEAAVMAAHPDAMIIRTNAYGWAPGGRGWLETVLAKIEARRPLDLDPIRHATPILATDLADILERALEQSLTGVYHLAGAERISPLAFAQRLAGQFNLPWLPVAKESALTDAPTGFGASESSLQTKKLRRDLCLAMPLLSESLDRLEAQQINGDRARLGAHGPLQLRAA